MMPHVDGLTACRRLRERGEQLPVLMLTARHAVSDRVAGLDAGADDYLVKPFAARRAAGPRPGPAAPDRATSGGDRDGRSGSPTSSLDPPTRARSNGAAGRSS